MMTLRPLVGAALLSTLGFANAAYAASCDFALPRDVVISITRNDGAIEYNNRNSRADLQRMQRRTVRTGAFGNQWTPVGLTLTELKYGMRVKIEAIQLGDQQFCARLTGVNAHLGYDKIQVFVARKFQPGSCHYNSVTEHELTHVRVFQNTLNSYFPRLQRRLERAAQAVQPIRANSPQAAAARLQRHLSATIDPLFKDMNRTLDRENAKLDTPARYRAEQARCSNW